MSVRDSLTGFAVLVVVFLGLGARTAQVPGGGGAAAEATSAVPGALGTSSTAVLAGGQSLQVQTPAGAMTVVVGKESGPPPPPPRPASRIRAVLQPWCAGGTDGAWVPGRCRVDYLLALLPDPATSGQSPLYDIFLDGIQRTMADHRYYFVEELADDAKDGKTARPAPWALLFRGENPGQATQRWWIVLVVHETPTAGLRPDEVLARLEAVRDLSTAPGGPALPHTVGILGPTYSGTVPSLGTALRRALDGAWAGHAFEVHSGSATAAGNAAALASYCGNPFGYLCPVCIPDDTPTTADAAEIPVGCSSGCVFTGHLLTDQAALRPLIEYLESQGVEPQRTAVLAESGTAFGSAATGQAEQSGPWFYVKYDYPFDVARLRAVLPESASTDEVLPRVDTTALTRVPFGEAGDSDRPGTVSPRSRAAYVERELMNVAENVEDNDIQVLAISATNVMDMVFLVSFFYRHCPDLRIVSLGFDLLHEFQGVASAIPGLLAVGSGYPWYEFGDGRVRVFLNQEAGGLHAALDTLLDGDTRAIADAGWLWVMGSTQWWPLRGPSELSDAERVFLRDQAVDSPPDRVFLMLYGLLILWLAFAGWRLLVAPRPDGSRPCAYESTRILSTAAGDGDAWYVALLGAAILSAVLAGLPGALAGWSIARWADPSDAGVLYLAWAVAMGLAALVVPAVRAVLRRDRGTTWLAAVLLIGVGTLWPLAGGWATPFVAERLGWEAYLQHLRFVTPTSGLSPLLTWFALTGVVAVWAWGHLRNLRLREVLGRGDADLRSLGTMRGATPLDPSKGDPTEGLPGLRCGALAPVEFLVAVCVGVLGLILYRPAMLTLEGENFSRVVVSLAFVDITLIAVTVGRSFLLWRQLRDFLHTLEWTPLVEAFRALGEGVKKDSATSSWFAMSEDYLRLLHRWRGDLLPRLPAAIADGPPDGLLARRALFRQCLDKVNAAWAGRPAESVPADEVRYLALALATTLRLVVLQLRTLLSAALAGWLLLFLALLVYPFQPHQALLWCLTAVFLAVAVPSLYVFAHLDRNGILSHLSGTDPGRLSGHFLGLAASRGAIPVLLVVIAQVPDLGRLIFSWLGPMLLRLR